VVERKDSGSRHPLRARTGSHRGRRGRPVLQEPVVAAADGERRNRPGVGDRGILCVQRLERGILKGWNEVLNLDRYEFA